VDHIVPHRRNPQRLHDLKNLQLLCRSCHGVKSQREQQGGPAAPASAIAGGVAKKLTAAGVRDGAPLEYTGF
jgi:5-methylcytosine-specific restriction endonuclease McrA